MAIHCLISTYFLLLLCYCSAASFQSVNYVTASGKDCPVVGNTTCGTLASYFTNSSFAAVEDSVFYFIDSGIHLLEADSITVSNITNIAFIGYEGQAEIACPRGEGGFVFIGCSNVHISALTLTNCSSDVSSLIPDSRRSPAAVVVLETFNTTLESVTVQDSAFGYGLVAWNAYGLNLTGSTFTGNRLGVYVIYAVPDVCFTSLSTFDLTINSCTFTYTRFEFTAALALHMQNLFTYRVNIIIDDITVHSNVFINIIYAFLDGFPRSARISNTLSTNASYGLVIYNRNIFTSGATSTSCTNFHDPSDYHSAMIEVNDSEFSYNTLDGAHASLGQFSTYFKVSSLDVQYNRCTFTRNDGAGIFWDRDLDELTILTVRITDALFTENSRQTDSAAIFIYRTESYLEDVVVIDNYQSGLLLLSSKVTFSGSKNFFVNNTGYNGGGIALFHSDLIITRNTSMAFIGNAVTDKGGAVYVERVCGLQILESFDNKTLNNVSLTFLDNFAPIGADIYGASSPRHCSVNVGNLDDVLHLNVAPGKILQSATNSVGLCKCDIHGNKNDTLLEECFDATFNSNGFVTLDKSAYPGDYIEVPVGVVGFGGPPATYSLTNGVINYLVGGRVVSGVPYNGTHCHVIHERVYHLDPSSDTMEIMIQAEPSYLNVLSTNTYPYILLNITLLPCPDGFNLVNGSCQCVDILQDQPASINCTIHTEEIIVKRTGSVWYGLVLSDLNETCFVTDTTCGYNYCTEDSVTFNMANETNTQCNFGREGLLCGKCPTGQSLQFGSNQCSECGNGWIAFLILFILAGIALVLLITVLNITVSVGTINGLIFYANIIKMYEFVFFPKGPIPFVSQFISWLNLDLGIKVCFYDGMDTYGKAWLQFVFPLYIWILILTIIALCQLSSKVSKLFGSHVVSVLSTLFLLSYIKLLRAIIFVLSPQRVHLRCINGNTYSSLRWLADPTVHYFDPKHTLLFCFAVALLIVFVAPYTFGLLFSPLLEGYFSKYKICSFWHKLKPIFDAYNAPYKDKLRFWTGYLLVVRLPILAIESVLNSVNTDKNTLLSVMILLVVLSLTISNCVKGVYRIWYINVIESFFLLNTVVIAVAATNDVYTDTYTTFLVISIVLSFIVSAGIVCFHVYLKFSGGKGSETELKMQRLGTLMLKLIVRDDEGDVSKEGRPSAGAINTTGFEWYIKDNTDRKTDNTTHPNSNASTSSTIELRRRETLILEDSQYVLATD